LTAVKPATITASVGAISTSTLVAIAADLFISVTTNSAVTGQATSFNASAQQSNGAVQYTFQFGDGFFAGPGASTATHFYGRSGSYAVTVSAIDAAGRSGATALSLTVND